MKKSSKLYAFIFCLLLALGMAPMAALAEDAGGSLTAAVPVLQTQEEQGAVADWEAADFTYGDYEKTLYGCDYSREFVVSGKVVTGFSEAGEAKLAECKNLVIPAKDNEGNTIIGVGTSAFNGRGLTSVQFPQTPLIDYDDVATHGHITKRGNFIIAESAFANNNLTEVTLPNGVLAVLANAFQKNQITRVNLPRSIWWIETLSFANNQIDFVNFPQTCDFQLEMHGMAFADNNIKAVRLPDFTEVVNMHVFSFNPGMEPIPADAPDKYKTYGTGEDAKVCGVVYMYADADLTDKGRIHHIDRATSNTKSWNQRLIINNSPESEVFTPYDQTEIAQLGWIAADFTYDGSVVTGLSESGLAKRADGQHRNLVIPERTSAGINVTEIAAAGTDAGGLFGTATEGFDSVYIPSQCTKIGANAFRALGTVNEETHVVENGLKEITFSPDLVEIGTSAFMMNSLTSVSLPNKVTTVGAGAFATNPGLAHIGLSLGMTEIANAAFGCSDGKNYMDNLTELTIPSGITKIGARAFAGNNISNIVIPEGVTEIGEYAFSTKNYLDSSCTLSLPEGLKTIGKMAFRNKVISSVVLPTTVTSLPSGDTPQAGDVFTKEYSDGRTPLNTMVLVSNEAQFNDKVNFADSKYRTIYYTESNDWTAADFTYGEWDLAPEMILPGVDQDKKLISTIWAVTGLTELGKIKLESNKNLVIPAADTEGKAVQGIKTNIADFKNAKLESVQLPTVAVNDSDKEWSPSVAEKGYFFIGQTVFSGNNLTSLDIPDGVLYVGKGAFQNNKLTSVSFPESIMYIGQSAFYKNSISSLTFTDKTTYPLNMDTLAFGVNQLRSISIPDNIERLGAKTPAATKSTVFMQNPGMEPVTGTTNANLLKGGVVWLYKATDTIGEYVYCTNNEGSFCQKVVIGAIPEVDAPWGVGDFTFDEAGTTVTGLSDAGKAKLKVNPGLVIPDQNDGKDITAIGAGVLGTNTVSDTYVGNIGTFGFKEEGGEVYVPASVVLPAHLQSIGDNAFSSYIDTVGGAHKGVTAVSLPASLTTIGANAFHSAPLTAVSIPDSVVSMGTGAFMTTANSVVKMSTAKLSSNVTELPASVFAQQAIKDIVIPDGVTTIGQRAFQGNPCKTLTLPSTLTAIPNYAFENHQLSNLEIPASVKTIGNYAFRSYVEGQPRTLVSLKLHEGLTSIGNQSFAGSMLGALDLPTTVTTVHKDAFRDSEATVQLLASVADQANAAGDYAKVVTTGSGHKVVYNPEVGNGWYAFDFTYSEDGTTITGLSEAGKAKAKTNHDLVLPNAVVGADEGVVITTIGEGAFMGDEAAVGKTGYVAEDAFTSVVLPSGLTTIEKDAFAFNSLTEMKFAECPSLASIGETAFKGNKLQTVELPDSVTELGGGSFSANNISTLKLSSGVTVIPQGAFSMNINLRKIEIPNTVTEIGESAFAGARLENLEIPASVAKIDKAAFKLHRISELTIPGTVKELGESAFEGTYKDQTLTTLTLEEGIETIGRYAFKEGLLTELKLPSSVTSLGDEPFLNNVGKNGSDVVEVVTDNPAQLPFGQGQKSFKMVCTDEAAQQAFDKQEADKASEVISALPVEPTLEDAEAVAAARAAYEALTDDQQALVPAETFAKLEAAEAAIASAQAVADVAAAIEALPAEPTLDDANAVAAARAAYDALSAEEQAKLPEGVAAKLEAAEAAVKDAVDQKAADDVASAINALPAEPTIDNADAVAAARAAYDALTDDQKAKLPEGVAAKLEAAEAAIASARAVADAAAAIANLPAEPTLDDAEAVAAARVAYDALTPEEQAKLPDGSLAKLEAAEKAIADAKDAADQKAADDVANAIDALPAEPTLDNAEAVAAARAAYDALTEDQKAKLPEGTAAKLEAAEAAVKAAADKAEADKVAKLIEAAKGGTDPAAVAAARAAYDALTPDQKALISADTLKTLTDAEAAVKAAGQAQKTKKANTMTANGKKVKLKAKTLKSKKATIKAKKAYTVKDAVGAVKYAKVKVTTKVKGNKKKIAKKFVVSKGTGKITVKKGVKKGLYKLQVRITAQGDASYDALTKTVTVKIKVK